jgi:hypothetical protein
MTTSRALARLRSESGQSTIEFGGMIVWLLIAAVFAWQLALAGWTAVSAGNAARTAARMWSRDGDWHTAGEQALNSGLRKNAHIWMEGEQVKVNVPIPVVFPGLLPLKPPLSITESADMPHTG